MGKRDGTEPDIPALRDLLRDYPYFAPAQVILAARLRKSGADPEEIKKQVGKAAIYLPDPFLLEHMLGRIETALEEAPPDARGSRAENPEATPGSPVVPEPVSGFSEPAPGENGMEADLPDQDSPPDGAGFPLPQSPDSGSTLIPGGTGESVTGEMVPGISGTGAAPEAPDRDAGGSETLPEPGFLREPSGLSESSRSRESSESLHSGSGIPSPFEKPIPPPLPISSREGMDDLQNLVRPLYTEDYFAFQGIRLPEKLDDTKKPTSAQVKSFTDWLRAMKRPKGSVGPEGIHLQDKDRISSIYTVDEERGISTVVEKMALESIRHGEEVVTEAMAEIRYRQGQKDKAVAIYEKLSLLDPSKSGYFADKISQIRQSL